MYRLSNPSGEQAVGVTCIIMQSHVALNDPLNNDITTTSRITPVDNIVGREIVANCTNVIRKQQIQIQSIELLGMDDKMLTEVG